MKVLIIGAGAREHTIAWKMNKSERVSKIFIAPGNAGTKEIGVNVDINVDEINKLMEFAKNNKIDMTIVGPEIPLVMGITDLFRENNLNIIGPDKLGSKLEGSKAFAKEFMIKHNIKTAKYKEYNEFNEAKNDLGIYGYPMVIKADGLAGGKGVLIPESEKEALEALNELMNNKKFGDAGNKIIFEEFLEGIEASILCFVDGDTILPMDSAQDYKRALDNDKGLNTGGMGTYSPSVLFNDELILKVEKEVLEPFVKGIKEEKMDFRGIIFVGLMIKNNEINVLEFNVRFGDPETQVILPRLENDLYDVFEKMNQKRLNEIELKWKKEKAVCVVLASGGYPENYEKGYEINGLENIDMVFHAGTKYENDSILTNGGRVLSIVSFGEHVKDARKNSYEKIKKIKFKDMYYRMDIAKL
ncbi:phosphoribosylamine--glycine ligase [Clostridiaceae bacterium HSG29]|nr:phosphoribosylamine--glycine ligase [Clostridiaceae bacterium HSG29]